MCPGSTANAIYTGTFGTAATLCTGLTDNKIIRRISTSFSLSTHWKNYDVFSRQKIKTFRSSRPAVLELASRYKDIVTQMEADQSKTGAEHDEARRILFFEMLEICLWGNATDLSLLTNLTYEDIQKLQGSEARKASEKNILVNDLGTAYETLLEAKREGKAERRVDIVLDNAGFELYVDLILAGYLLSSGLATTVVLHPKVIPWFVSDVVPADFPALLNALANPRSFYETPSDEEKLQGKAAPPPLAEKEASDLGFLFQEWSRHHAEGELVLRPRRSWTWPGSYWRLPPLDKELYEDLKESELVVFKGDLNYRKLTGDVCSFPFSSQHYIYMHSREDSKKKRSNTQIQAAWDPTTPFTTAIGPLGPGSGVNVLALRTCKADVVVGLKPGVDEELRAKEGGGGDSGARKWAWSGKWAVVSYSQGK